MRLMNTFWATLFDLAAPPWQSSDCGLQDMDFTIYTILDSAIGRGASPSLRFTNLKSAALKF
jgi:hypothetical protein